MNRREFLIASVATLVGCGRNASDTRARLYIGGNTVTLYDTHAMALYFDGGLGPATGIVTVADVVAEKSVTLEFWHGHGGQSHFFTIEPEHFRDLHRLKKVVLETTEVANHTHKLFIDPVDARWRVSGAKPVQVPVLP
jgi:hypothetical protein